MIRTTSSKQLTIAKFDWPFETALDKHNRWVKLSECIPWDDLAESCYQGLMADRGRPLKDARLVIGAVIEAHEGKKPVKPEPNSPPDSATPAKPDAEPAEEKAGCSADKTEAQTKPESSITAPRGQLILDASVVEQAIRFPSDLSVLNEAREFSEQIIDTLCAHLKVGHKPRTYQRKARAAYLAIIRHG